MLFELIRVKAHRGRMSYTNYCTSEKIVMILAFEPNVMLCNTLQQPHNRTHHSNTTVYRMFFVFVSSAVKWVQVSFCQFGRADVAIWLPHNLDGVDQYSAQ